ncbi:ferritin family protein [Rhodococcus artemisiae]|uniref:propane 2-monooxygenase n=1 Tax=Rhodococcus artemisiae TaxID=714159 RepID=A0ABU7LIZ5_9NOCA|nr:monooxygenase [Rhodococcus artemisiae]MEE2061533.1 monooxygenase [Rhodococcus artemisiae]
MIAIEQEIPEAPGFASPRDLTYLKPRRRRISEYEAVICAVQPDMNQYETGGWYYLRPNGEGTYDSSSTRLVHPDWFEFRDPSSAWQRPYTKNKAQHERAIEAAVETVKQNGSLDNISEAWLGLIAQYYEAFACFEWGLFKAYAFVGREALSDTLTMTATFSCADRLAHQQDIALFSLELSDHLTGYSEGIGKKTWLNDEKCQGARKLIEKLCTVDDWCEVVLVTHLLIDPLLTNFISRALFQSQAARHGDVATAVIETMSEQDRARALDSTLELLSMLTGEKSRSGLPVPAEQNRGVIQELIDHWEPMVMDALAGFSVVYDLIRSPDDEAADDIVCRAYEKTSALLSQYGLNLERLEQ